MRLATLSAHAVTFWRLIGGSHFQPPRCLHHIPNRRATLTLRQAAGKSPWLSRKEMLVEP
jgi:hypothetical protein